MFARRRCTLFALILFATAFAGAVTTPQDIRAALRELAKYDEINPSLVPYPKEFSDRALRLRHRLRDFAIGSVVDASHHATRVDDVLSLAQQRLREVEFPLQLSGRTAAGDVNPRAHLQLFEVSVPGWIGAKTTIELPCGRDHAVYFLRVREGAGGALEASLAFAKENAIDSVQDLSLDLQVAATQSPRGDALRIATIESGGGCVSYWHPVILRVFETSDQAYRPLRMFERERLAYLGDTLQPQVRFHENGFAFEYRTLFRLDADRSSRREEVRVANTEQGVRLLPPSPQDPLEFVDEWVTTPWPDAMRWTAAGRRSNVRRWHKNLAANLDARAQPLIVDSGECRTPGEVWVQLKTGETLDRMRSVYSLLSLGPSGYRVERFATELPQSCSSKPASEDR